MTSYWSRLHPLQKSLFFLGFLGGILSLSGVAIIQGLSFGLGVLMIGIILFAGSILVAFMFAGLEDPEA